MIETAPRKGLPWRQIRKRGQVVNSREVSNRELAGSTGRGEGAINIIRGKGTS